MTSLVSWIGEYLEAQKRAVDSVPVEMVARVVGILKDAHRVGSGIFVCGNGGNAANCSHFTTDLGKNASLAMSGPFRVLSLNENTAWMTAIGNDFHYDEVYVRQLMNYGKAGDVLMVSSVSGSSPNLVRAVEWANEHGMRTVAIVGGKRGRLAEIASEVLVVEDTHYGRVEDVQMHVLHMLCYAFVELPEVRA
jgi:D-sedoheptulose 7-phosphate isomerase